MVTFKHILITRFNLPKRWNSDKLGNAVLNNNWLEDRYRLFENYCLPSIKGQTNQNFEWWVYFDSNMDSYYKIKNEKICDNFSNFMPKYEDSYDNFEINMPKEIYKNLKAGNVDWVITTRLDNDDMLAKNTVEIIQNKVKFQHNYIIEIPFGYTLELLRLSKLRIVETLLNPFISFVEKVKEGNKIMSVYYYQHNRWEEFERDIISIQPQWIQLIHNKNVSNRANGYEVFYKKLDSRFCFNSNDIKFNKNHKIIFYKGIIWVIKVINHLKKKLKSSLKFIFNVKKD